jgi:hypothetical protein
MRTARLFTAGVGTIAMLALGAVSASGASTTPLLQLKTEGQPAKVGAELLMVAGYSLGECYFEEQEFKLLVNDAKTDKLVRTSQNGLAEDCDGGAEVVEITSAKKLTLRMAPMRIHVSGPCVYEFKEISGTFVQTEWGPEVAGAATGKLYAPESTHATACAKTRRTSFDIGLSGVETKLTSTS